MAKITTRLLRSMKRKGEKSQPASGPRNLAQGKKKKVTGTILDSGGHRLNGVVVVKQGGKTIGSARTAGGTYRIYDLAPGSYFFHFTVGKSTKSSRKVEVDKKKTITVNFRVR